MGQKRWKPLKTQELIVTIGLNTKEKWTILKVSDFKRKRWNAFGKLHQNTGVPIQILWKPCSTFSNGTEYHHLTDLDLNYNAKKPKPESVLMP